MTELMAVVMTAANDILLALESFSSGEAQDGCNCSVARDARHRS